MSDEVKKFISRGVKVGVKDYDDIRNGIKDLVNKDSKTVWVSKVITLEIPSQGSFQ